MGNFSLKAPFKPTGDQPEAIKALCNGVRSGARMQTLLGVTGSGKTFTMANVINELNRPTLVLAHNKTLAAQLCLEFREFFPDNAVGYFVSYYDYFQPEAYIPGKDLYIEKDALINDEIDKLRHDATSSLFERRDVIIVSSVSCIYSLGDPEEYEDLVLSLRPGMQIERNELLRRLVAINYERNDVNFVRNKFRVRGDVVEIFPASSGEKAVRVEFFGDEIDRVTEINVLQGKVERELSYAAIFPATHYAVSDGKREAALQTIRDELEERVQYFESQGKLLEAERIRQRTEYDLEMISEVGFCSGIENYSRVFSGRDPGSTPFCLLDYFPDDYLILVDESHVTLPQVRAMSAGDRARKENLVEFGFRLPSAFDNRPLVFDEFMQKAGQMICFSATPADYEKKNSAVIAEQLIRPTGLCDPEIIVRSAEGQVDDLLGEIRMRTEKGQRTLVTTLTTKMAEDLTEFIRSNGIKVQYLHHEVDTMERTEILRDLRLGVYDVLVGINLLREGLDLPEVSLVAILDADKEGFLRSEVSLIQTIGRAARHEEGLVIMYADKITDSMQRAMDETLRRRTLQMKYNEEHGITPRSVVKSVRDLIEITPKEEKSKKKAKDKPLTAKEKQLLIDELTLKMKDAAKHLRFEEAAAIRDRIRNLT